METFIHVCMCIWLIISNAVSAFSLFVFFFNSWFDLLQRYRLSIQDGIVFLCSHKNLVWFDLDTLTFKRVGCWFSIQHTHTDCSTHFYFFLFWLCGVWLCVYYVCNVISKTDRAQTMKKDLWWKLLASTTTSTFIRTTITERIDISDSAQQNKVSNLSQLVFVVYNTHISTTTIKKKKRTPIDENKYMRKFIRLTTTTTANTKHAHTHTIST